ncbi:4-diphosphocytidyl-2-C-methyl-D-erythritol kinase [Planctomycetales bacterium]|nr:4-diphosphocytidyl-2-C-methyl-D-erythritol kinase [Planctomycetales bacterium]
MQITKTENIWCVQAPAKLNLFFEVHNKRADGFHEITSLAVPVSLYDTVYFEPLTPETYQSGGCEAAVNASAVNSNAVTSDILFECSGSGGLSADIPIDGRNIVVKALELFRQRFRIKQGAKVKLIKRIPSQAGLGGGSSDASAVLLAAREAWKPNLTLQELSGLSAEIGSDCPLFFNDGASLISGRGEIIQPFNDCPPLHFVILKPDEGLSTAEVYRQCMPLRSASGKIRNIDNLLSALQSGSLEDIGRNFFNFLEFPAEKLWHNFTAVQERLENAGCIAVRMTGSGTAFYGLCRNGEDAENIAEQLRKTLRQGEAVFAVRS